MRVERRFVHADGDGDDRAGPGPPGATLDQAPVNVSVTTQRGRQRVGGAGERVARLARWWRRVEVVSGSSHHLVGVTTGLYSDTLVEISGSGIGPGTVVEVPSS